MKKFKASEYLRKNPRTVMLHFQPETIAVMEKPAELDMWLKNLKENCGIDLKALGVTAEDLVNNVEGGYTQGYCTDPEGKEYLDTCDE